MTMREKLKSYCISQGYSCSCLGENCILYKTDFKCGKDDEFLEMSLDDVRKCFNLVFGKDEVTHEHDNVEHPSHYETGKFECIEVMIEVMGVDAVKDFCVCNAFKYLYRHKRKNGKEDLQKAVWYINKYLELAKESEVNKNGKDI